MKKLYTLLHEPVNNASLTVFRIAFGLLLAAEGFGAIMTGWVKNVYIDTQFNFQFFGFEWLDIFHGYPMYGVFVGLGISGLAIALGYRYRIAMLAYAMLWSITYLGQKMSYNNHYYLMFLLCWFAVFIPMHARYSLDVKYGRVKEVGQLPFYLNYFFVFMFAVVYLYASVNKIYPDWLSGRYIKGSMQNKFLMTIPLLRSFTTKSWYLMLVSYSAIVYDGLVIPALLWKKTRKVAIFFSFVFHLYNSVVYQVGIFPYMSLSILLFFVSHAFLERMIGEVQNDTDTLERKPKLSLSYYAFVGILLFHLLMPLRHRFIEGNVFYTEEGHRCSWRMMLRNKSGSCRITVKRADGTIERLKLTDLTHKQKRLLYKLPDVLYAYIQKVKEKYPDEDVQIFADVRVGLNGRKRKGLVDKDRDLSKVSWSYFQHNDWVNSYGFEE